LRSHAAKVCYRLLKFGCGAGAERYSCAFARERRRHGFTDASAAAGNQRNLIFELHRNPPRNFISLFLAVLVIEANTELLSHFLAEDRKSAGEWLWTS
jgi:hypothetical protein